MSTNPLLQRWRERLRPELLILAWAWIFLWHGYSTGPSDDEAYYWVLAQRPALGYAYHPPAVAWSIAAFQAIFGSYSGYLGTLVFRFPALIWSMLILFFALKSIRLFRQKTVQKNLKLTEFLAIAIVLALPGVFGLSWMMVPDLPLYCGVMGLFYFTSKIIESEHGPLRILKVDAFGLSFFAALSVFSKFSGVLAILASGASLFLFLNFKQKTVLKQVLLLLCVGLLMGLLPTLIWNASHEWGALKYQFIERHQSSGGIEFNGVRWMRSLLIQAIAIGPLLFYGPWLLFKGIAAKKRWAMTLGMFAAFHAVFLFQPLLSDFKPHWAFIIWLFVALYQAIEVVNHGWKLRHWIQATYFVVLVGAVLWACQTPWLGQLIQKLDLGKTPEQVALLDISNDLYGWDELPRLMPEFSTTQILVGGRYQTAAQAAFALRQTPWQVTLLPRDTKALDEWPMSGVTTGDQINPLVFTQTFFYVTDLRFNAAPVFQGVDCKVFRTASMRRGVLLAKRLTVYQCFPNH